MRSRLAVGMCMMFALALASFAGSAMTNEENLITALASGIEESGFVVMDIQQFETVFSSGFEDSSGTGLYGFNTSVWEVAYGTDGDESAIQSLVVRSGIYAAQMEEGDEGDVSITTKAGMIDLSSYESCNLSFWIIQNADESGEGSYVDIYDGSWHYAAMRFNGNLGDSWKYKKISLSDYSLNEPNFQIRWRAEFKHDKDKLYLDDIAITCLKNSSQPDTTPPQKVSGLSASAVSRSWIFWNWTNPSDSDFSHCIIYIDGINAINVTSSNYNLSGLESFEEYRIDIQTADKNGNINQDNATESVRTEGEDIPVSLAIQDSANNSLDAQIIITNSSGAEVANSSSSGTIVLAQGIYNLEIILANSSLQNIEISNATIRESGGKIIEIDTGFTMPDVVKSYAINPIIDFDIATVTAVAQGSMLYKCMDWNFTSRQCFGDWAPLAAIAPGSLYNFTLTPFDPGLIEVNGTFFDGFESGTFATNNWVNSGTGNDWIVSAVNSYAGTYNAFGEPAGGLKYLEASIDTSGYINIFFSYYRRDSGLDAGEYCGADWYNGTGWVQVDSAVLGWNYVLRNYSLPNAAANNPNFRIRFKVNANSNNERCYIDNVQVAGIRDSIKPNVTLVSPADNYFSQAMDPVNVTFQCSVTDNLKLKNISLYITNSSNKNFRINATSLISGKSNSTSWTLSLPRGNYTWNCLAHDFVGNYDWGNSNRTFKLNYTDTVKPNIVLNYPANNYMTTSRNITFNWTASDNYDSFVYCNLTVNGIVKASGIASQDGVPESYKVTGLTDGDHYWNVTCWDKTGNKNTSATRKLTVDATPPAIAINFPPANYSTKLASISFNWTATDNYFTVLNCNLTIDGNVNATVAVLSGVAENYTVSGLSEADHYWNVTCWDALGNANTSKTRKFTVDMTNPQVQFVSPTTLSGNYTNNQIYANVTAYDLNLDSINVYLYKNSEIASSTHSHSSPYYVSFTGLEDGIYYLNATANDTAGNLNQTETRKILIDTTPPLVSLNFPPDSYVTFGTAINFSWTASDNVHDFMVCNLTINGTVTASGILSPNGMPAYYYVSGLSEGAYQWNVTCAHSLGYADTSPTRSFIISLNTPTIAINSPPNSSLDVDGNITFNCTAADNNSLSRVELYINSALNQTDYVSGTENTSLFYLQSANGSSYNWTCKSYNSLNTSSLAAENREVSVDFSAAPVYSPIYFAGSTTNWMVVPNIKSVCGGAAVLDNPSFSKVEWYGCVNAAWENFDSNVKLEYNNVTVQPGIDSTFNSSARVTLRNLPWNAVPDVYRNGVICLPPQCSNVSYNTTTGTAVFNVTHFTSYTTAGNAQLMIWDQTDSGMPYAGYIRYVNQNAKFFANYTRVLNSQPISGATCEINFTGSSGIMAYNSTTKLFEYTRTFSSNGTFEWNVTCARVGFETLTTNDTIIITPDISAPAITLNYPANNFNTTSTSINFTWTAADNYDKNMSCSLIINNIVNASNLYSLNGTPRSYTVSGFASSVYYWKVNCTDDFNNTGTSETRVFRVDTIPPEIIIDSPQTGSKFESNSNITISAIITETITAVDYVYANVTILSFSYIVPMSRVGNSDTFSGVFKNTSMYGTYTFTVFANDTLGNKNSTSGNFIISVPSVSFVECTLTQTPQVAESGEMVLFQADLAFTSGQEVYPGNLTDINITIYYVNSTSTTKIETGDMLFLQKSVWYYEFGAGYNKNGNYLGVVNIKTNEVPPHFPSCSALFTISGRGIFKIAGITPDIVNINETVRLAAEITLNGELVSSSTLVNPKLWVKMINGSTQFYNSTTGLGISDGLIFLDGEFNQTGVYYLNWTVEYYNRTKNVQEIVVVKDWDQKLNNISVGGGLQQLINENKQKLVELLKEMELHQQFSEEEVFLVTDAVNSMSRVADMLADGEITEEEAIREINRLNRELEEKSGGRLTGYFTNILGGGSDEHGFSWWPVLLSLIVLAALVTGITMRARRNRGKEGYSQKGYSSRSIRRYELLIMKIRMMLNMRANRSRNNQFGPGKNVPLSRFFERRPNHERQETIFESISTGVDRMRNKMKHNAYMPTQKRRYEAVLEGIGRKISDARIKSENRSYEKIQKKMQKEMMARRAKPEEIFRPMPPKQTPRYAVLASALKKGMHDYMLRKKSTRHMHMQKERRNGITHVKMNAKDLFRAIDEYKVNEGACNGTIRDDSPRYVEEEYRNAAKGSVFEENRAVVGLRNAISSVNESIIGEGLRKVAEKIPKPQIPKIRFPRKDEDVNLDNIYNEKIHGAQDKMPNEKSGHFRPGIREIISKKIEARRAQKADEIIRNSEIEKELGSAKPKNGAGNVYPKEMPKSAKPMPAEIENEDKADDGIPEIVSPRQKIAAKPNLNLQSSVKPLPQKAKPAGRRRYEIIISSIRKGMDSRKEEKSGRKKLNAEMKKMKQIQKEKKSEERKKAMQRANEARLRKEHKAMSGIKPGIRRYQALSSAIRKNFSSKKENGALELLKSIAERENIAEKVSSIERKETMLENDKIRHLAWNWEKVNAKVNKAMIKKAFPSDSDDEAFQSTDEEIALPKPTKSQKMSQLKKMFEK